MENHIVSAQPVQAVLPVFENSCGELLEVFSETLNSATLTAITSAVDMRPDNDHSHPGTPTAPPRCVTELLDALMGAATAPEMDQVISRIGRTGFYTEHLTHQCLAHLNGRNLSAAGFVWRDLPYSQTYLFRSTFTTDKTREC